MARLPPDNRAAATLRLQAERMPAELLARFRQEWSRFAGEENAGTRRVLHAWTGALLADMDSAESKLPALADFERLEGETNMATVSQALYAEWLAGVRAEHVAEGIKQERARGEMALERLLGDLAHCCSFTLKSPLSLERSPPE